MSTSILHAFLPPSTKPKKLKHHNVIRPYDRTMEDYMQEVERLFQAPLQPVKLIQYSQKLQNAYRSALRTRTDCMLPTYNHTLPTGKEAGLYMALDVGGSTLRVALILLHGRQSSIKSKEIVYLRSFRIGEQVRHLEGTTFFDWMASRIGEVLSDPAVSKLRGPKTLATGLAWSFPVEQISQRSGLLCDMGKGFRASVGCLGQDLSQLVTVACRKQDLDVRIDAIINDCTATLLSQAYDDSSTRLALVLGTGLNAAIHLPVSAVARAKYGQRPDSWHAEAKHVLINTEISMFGKDMLPTTRWDDYLNMTHVRPDFQPFEHMCSGRYLGEIVRLILTEAVQVAGLFGGEVPVGLLEPYALDTGLIAAFESDKSARLSEASAAFLKTHPLTRPVSYKDLLHVKRICHLVSQRAAAYLATGIHGLWALRLSAEGLSPATAGHVDIGCNGSVIEHYPSFRPTCQRYINQLVIASGGQANSVTLDIADESALYGAAVAVGCLEDEPTVNLGSVSLEWWTWDVYVICMEDKDYVRGSYDDFCTHDTHK